MTANESTAQQLRRELSDGHTCAFIGVYDAFSASIAAKHFPGLFVSGLSFGASHYGLPDTGFLSWGDVVAFVHRLRAILPESLLLVDIDDGYGDADIAEHVVTLLEHAGAAGVVMEDQKRPRRCGHLPGKQLLPLEEYVSKLQRVLSARENLLIVARTDAQGEDEILRRVKAFDEAGADAVLVDGLEDAAMIARLRRCTARPLAYNEISGGKTPLLSLDQLQELGVAIAIHSTPCLFAAQEAVEAAIEHIKKTGALPAGPIDLRRCLAILDDNLKSAGQR